MLNDLAAAHYLRAQRLDRPYDIVLALSWVLEAQAIDPESTIIAFNRALYSTRLHLETDARRSWRYYLTIDGTSAWANEARHELARLERLPIPLRWQRNFPDLVDAAQREDLQKLESMVAISSQHAREWVIEELLPSWGKSYLEGSTSQNDDRLRAARSVGQVLAVQGDDSIRWAVAEIDAAFTEHDALRLALLAEGISQYGEGRRLDRAYAAEEAASILDRAIIALYAARSSFVWWAEASLASTETTRSLFDSAFGRYLRIEAEARSRDFLALIGIAEWGQGQILVRRGSFSQGLPHFLQATAPFHQLGEWENVGGAEDMAAEAYKLLGNRDQQWKLVYRAVGKLRFFPSSRRLHNLLWDVGSTASLDGQPLLAKLLHDEGVAVARRSGNHEILLVALTHRSRSLQEAGRREEAQRDREEARRLLGSIRGEGLMARLRAEVDLTTAIALKEEDPEHALNLFGQLSNQYTEQEKPIQLVDTLLAKVQALVNRADASSAEATLDQAIEVLDSERARISGVEFASSHADLVARVYDQKVLLLTRRGDFEEALAVTDYAKSILESRSSRPENPRWLDELPADTILLEYAIIEDSLLIWSVQKGSLQFTRRELGDLEARIARFRDLLQWSQDTENLERSIFQSVIPLEVVAGPVPRHLVVVGDKVLHTLPFSALFDPERKRYLVEDFVITTSPSLKSFVEGTERRKNMESPLRSILIAGEADWDRTIYPNLDTLSFESAEIANVARGFETSKLLLGPQATPHLLAEALDDFDVFHFTGHAIRNAERPFSSHLVLTPGPGDSGLLTAEAISTLRPGNLRVVVLSACETLSPNPTRTGSFAGLGQAFLSTGTPTVVGTLWKVDDRAAMELMSRFYGYFRTLQMPAEALRLAQLSFQQDHDPAFRRVASWAAFQTNGAF